MRALLLKLGKYLGEPWVLRGAGAGMGILGVDERSFLGRIWRLASLSRCGAARPFWEAICIQVAGLARSRASLRISSARAAGD